MSDHENHEELELDDDEMDIEYDIVTLLDEDDQEHEFEQIDFLIHEDTEYRALVPIFEDAEELLQDSGELVIMRVSEVDGEFYLDTIEDDDEYDTVSALFVDRLSDDFDILEEFDNELD